MTKIKIHKNDRGTHDLDDLSLKESDRKSDDREADLVMSAFFVKNSKNT